MTVNVQCEGSLKDYVKDNLESFKNGLNSFIWRNKAGTVKKSREEPCFASITSYSPIQEMRAVISSSHFKEPKEKWKPYWEYIIYHSPFRKAFNPGSVRKIDTILKQGVAMNTNYHLCFLTAAMLALRIAWEYPSFLLGFEKFKSLGISPELSFILASYVTPNGKVGGINMGGHGLFDLDKVDKAFVQNFKKGITPNFLTPAKEDSSSYRGFFILFANDKKLEVYGGVAKNNLKDFLNNIGKGDEKSFYGYKELDLNNPEIINKLKEWE